MSAILTTSAFWEMLALLGKSASLENSAMWTLSAVPQVAAFSGFFGSFDGIYNHVSFGKMVVFGKMGGFGKKKNIGKYF